MTLLLECRVSRGVGRPLGAADGEVRVGERRAERAEQQLVGGERIERFLLRRGQAYDPTPRPLVLGDRGGSTSSGSGGSSARSSPSRPAAIRPPRARYGLHVASHAFSSAFVDASSAPRKTEATRTGASRLS